MFRWLRDLFTNAARRKREIELANSQFTNSTKAGPLPLDPANDPWRT